MGRLQEQMKADLLLKRYSPHTTRAYARCIRNFAKHFMRPPRNGRNRGASVHGHTLILSKFARISSFTIPSMSLWYFRLKASCTML